jgi:hypothetical protein
MGELQSTNGKHRRGVAIDDVDVNGPSSTAAAAMNANGRWPSST